jgi:hypothetical protein
LEVVGEGACEGPVVEIGVPLYATTAAVATATSTVAIINTFAALGHRAGVLKK